jgi:threonylcarbamoyladenosine tRNA methylthiotransferase MtaB
MFENSLDLVRECDLTWLHVFPFSPRTGTPAARMPQVDRSTINHRARKLRDIGRAQVAAHHFGKVGSTVEILLETARMGRTEQFAEVALDCSQPVGTLITVNITGTSANRLTGTFLR